MSWLARALSVGILGIMAYAVYADHGEDPGPHRVDVGESKLSERHNILYNPNTMVSGIYCLDSGVNHLVFTPTVGSQDGVKIVRVVTASSIAYEVYAVVGQDHEHKFKAACEKVLVHYGNGQAPQPDKKK